MSLFFMFILAISISSLKKCLFSYFAQFLNWLLDMLLLNYNSFYIFWIINHYRVYNLQKSSPILCIVFSPSCSILRSMKVLNVDKIQFIYFFCGLVSCLRIPLPNPRSQRFTPICSSKVL